MSNTPKIRFSGFTEDWEQRKVTDLGEIYIGLVTTMTEHYTDKGHLLIRNSDIKDGYFEFGENPIYLDEEFSEQNKSRMHQLGDVITVHTGDIGTSAVIGENEVNSIGFATIVTRPNQEILDSNYFATYLNTDTHKQWAVSMATGDGRSNYNLKDYTKLVVPIPEIEEQKKIAACIVNINSLITLHQRKYDDTKLLKKYMLQKMFPQNVQKVPEIRFSGFTGDWEQRKLGELGEIMTGSTPSTSKSEYYSEEGIPWVTPTDINALTISDTPKKLSEKGMKVGRVVPANTILCTCIASIGKNALLTVKGSFNQQINSLTPSAENDSYFLLTESELWSEKMKRMAASGTMQIVNKTEFSELDTMVPSLDEQKIIGLYFRNLDHLITLHQRKCDELKELKKYMLQNMFPQKG